MGTPLLIKASFCGHQDIVAALLAKKADVNVRNRNFKTPLSIASEMDHREIQEMLIKAGAK